jgi:ribosomal protein S18 acetylase RimI-like enzyme
MDPAAVTGPVTLRPVTADDRELLVEVYASSRDEELSQIAWAPGQREAFVRMQFDAQDADYHRTNPDGSFDVIEVDGRPAGRLYTDRSPGRLRIVDIALLPELRGRGAGAHLIGRLMEEAASSGSRLSIHVEIHNRAIGLYERLGFVTVGEHGLHRSMEWTAS